jgi:hypothetical protein
MPIFHNCSNLGFAKKSCLDRQMRPLMIQFVKHLPQRETVCSASPAAMPSQHNSPKLNWQNDLSKNVASRSPCIKALDLPYFQFGRAEKLDAASKANVCNEGTERRCGLGAEMPRTKE